MGQVYQLDPCLHLRVLYPRERIEAEVSRVAAEIGAAYAGKDLLAVIVLKGALFFAADLLRALRIPAQMDFLKLSSYDGTTSTGKVHIRQDIEIDVAGRDVLIIEDIVDTGLTLAFLTDLFRQRGAGSVAVCALIEKLGRRERDLKPDYVGISCAGGFLVGYGLDLNERMRELPDIYEVIEK